MTVTWNYVLYYSLTAVICCLFHAARTAYDLWYVARRTDGSDLQYVALQISGSDLWYTVRIAYWWKRPVICVRQNIQFNSSRWNRSTRHRHQAVTTANVTGATRAKTTNEGCDVKICSVPGKAFRWKHLLHRYKYRWSILTVRGKSHKKTFAKRESQ